MAFQLSPGVNVSEIDLTTIVPQVATTEAAFVGIFNWGPANTIISVSNEVELVATFGKPTSTANVFQSFFTAANFLSYGRNLRIVRALNTSQYNASDGGNANTRVVVSNRDDYLRLYPSLTARSNTNQSGFIAKYPGPAGKNLTVSVCMANAAANMYVDSTDFSAWTYANYFASAPNTSTYVASANGRTDEMHIVVTDGDANFQSIQGGVLETFGYVSKAIDAKNEDGSSNYYVDVLRDKSKYVYAISHIGTDFGNVAANKTFVNAYASVHNTSVVTEIFDNNGATATITDSDVIRGYDKFKNPEEVDISLVMLGQHSTNVAQHVVDNIVEFRKDAIAFISPPASSTIEVPGGETTAIANWRNNTLNKSSSYAFVDTGWKYQFDKYNNTYRWIPLNGDIAGLCARTDFERDPWFSPAGFNRGAIKNVVKLAFVPNKSQRDDLYKIGINPVVAFPGEGVILYGDKTLLSKPSAFDRINVRRLFIVLEKAIARAAKYSLFEFNDEFTRAQFVSLVEPYLRDVQGRRGIYDFRVVCDTTNNTPEVIDRNEFVGDIYIKPARSINFIQLNFIAVRTGVAFEEIVGRF